MITGWAQLNNEPNAWEENVGTRWEKHVGIDLEAWTWMKHLPA